MTDPATRWRAAIVAAAGLLPLSATRAEAIGMHTTTTDLLGRANQQEQRAASRQPELGTESFATYADWRARWRGPR